MELEKYDTTQAIQDLLAIRDDIDALAQKHVATESLGPKIDLFDLGDSYRLLIEVAGVPQENLEVAIQGSSLIVAGYREPIEADITILKSERPRGHFQRTIDLPSEVERDGSHAHLQEGVLILTLPKI